MTTTHTTALAGYKIDRSRCRGRMHGEYWMVHKYGCTCLDARLKLADYRRAQRKGARRIVDATAARRTVQGLAFHGYTAEQIATMCAVSVRTVRALQSGRKNTLWISKAESIRRAGDRARLDDYRTGYAAEQARSAARSHGWAPLTAWDDDTIGDPAAQPQLGDPNADVVDEVLIERVLEGEEQAQLSGANRAAAITIGAARGIPLYTIGRRLGVSHTKVKQLAQQAA